MKYIIKDWINNICFNGIEFDSLEDAWGYIYENDPNPNEEGNANYDEHWFDDYFVVEKEGAK